MRIEFDEWVLKTDGIQFIVGKEYTSYSKQQKKDVTIVQQATYHMTLESALKNLHRRKLMAKTIDSLDALFSTLEEYNKEMKDIKTKLAKVGL